MHVQHCVKGIKGESSPGAGDGLTWKAGIAMIASDDGIYSNWWRTRGTISPPEIQAVLTEHNLDRHLHDYTAFGHNTPFISLAAGAVLRDPATMTNLIYDAVDTALFFATEDWARPGALFFCWTVVGFHQAIPFEFISEPIRDLLIYRSWSPFHDEREITAKVHIPARQVIRVEWWDGSNNQTSPALTWDNPNYHAPAPLLNERELIREP
jgi:hypothetical protein